LQTLLGFDFGEKRTGVAVGQRVTGTATALCTLTASQGMPDWEGIDGLIGEWQPDALVVGLPRHADGTDAGITRTVRAFAQQLGERYRLPVHLMDERLSSQAATALAQDDRHGTEGLDAVAARIILQDWLDTENP
jgi:putative Holliday junction resolvase